MVEDTDAPTGADPAGSPGDGPGWLRKSIGRLTASNEQVEAEEEQTFSASRGGACISSLPLRAEATVCGMLRSVTLRPRAGVPALEAELYDGSGVVSLVWLGRRHIAGIEPGRRLRASGMVTGDDGEPMMFNPRYELLPPRC